MVMSTSDNGPVNAIPEPRKIADQIGPLWIVALLVLIGGVLLIAQLSAAPNEGFSDGAAVLAMVSLVAVGIERLIEMFWTLIATFKSAWWPLSAIAAAIDAVVDDTNKAVQPVFDLGIEGLGAARAKLQAAGGDIADIDAEIQRVRDQKTQYENQLKRIQSLGNDNQKVQLVATAAFQAVNRLDTAYGATMPKLRKAVNDANQVATGVSDILASFKENPAKKLLSIYLGSLIGLVVAGFVGLDLFAAAGASLTIGGWAIGSFVLLPNVGVAMTGLVLGLGASPTHHVINYITEAAKARKAGNLPQPEVDDRGGDTAQSPADVYQGRIVGLSPATSLRLAVAEEGGQRFVNVGAEEISALLNDAPLEFRLEPSPPRVRPASMSLPRRR